MADSSKTCLLSARTLPAQASLLRTAHCGLESQILDKRIHSNSSTASTPFNIADVQKQRLTVIYYTVT